MIKRAFGELEVAILQILKTGHRMTVKQVHEILGKDNKYNTIMTVMSRLAEKKRLGRERVGLQYEYWMLSPVDKEPSFFEQLKRKLLGVKTTEVVTYLIENAEDISEQEINEMEKLLEKARKKGK